LRVLPAVAAEAGGMAVMLDGGIRRGTDVLKALALGAHFVFVGRPFICAAAVRGEPGCGTPHPAVGGAPAEHGDARHHRSGADEPGDAAAPARRRLRGPGAWT
jgi:hypothetical protein